MFVGGEEVGELGVPSSLMMMSLALITSAMGGHGPGLGKAIGHFEFALLGAQRPPLSKSLGLT